MKNCTLNIESINDMQISASTNENVQNSMFSSSWENNDNVAKEWPPTL